MHFKLYTSLGDRIRLVKLELACGALFRGKTPARNFIIYSHMLVIITVKNIVLSGKLNSWLSTRSSASAGRFEKSETKYNFCAVETGANGCLKGLN